MKYLIPGLGANSNIYTGPLRHLKDSRFVEWPQWDGEITIADLAVKTPRHYRINENDTLIGISMGGMA
jgi:hypothetical protein